MVSTVLLLNHHPFRMRPTESYPNHTLVLVRIAAKGSIASVRCAHVIQVAIEPALTQLGRRNDRMAGGMRMLGGVSVWRAVAAQRHTTRLARAQVNPMRPDPHAFHALAARWSQHCSNRVQVRTGCFTGDHRHLRW